MPINSYTEALSYIYSYITYNPASTARWSLDRLKGLLAQLGNPHQQYPSILITGTKGKGSTVAISESILRSAGYKTGMYTSPHLHSFRERIRLFGEAVPETMLIKILNRCQPYFEATPNLTIFELITALAFTIFAEANVDTAVVEVGLGGRLDATNAIDAVVPVITPISYDHMQILGDTLTLIAGEKAGIIRPKSFVVSAPQFAEALQVVEQVCAAQQAELVVINQAYRWEIQEDSLAGQRFTLNGESYRLPLIGNHQVLNAITALTAVQGFAERTKLSVSSSALKAGLADVVWQGRMEILNREPYIIIDSAMNGHSAEQVAQTLQTYLPNRPITFIVGVSSDHPVEDMLTVLHPLAKQMLMTASRHPRAETPERLVARAAKLGFETIASPNVEDTLSRVWSQTAPDEVICVTGSLFLVADVREAWFKQQGLPVPKTDPMIALRKM